MNTSIPIRIKDVNRVLSELDRLQIKNMVWLQLYSLEQHVFSVTFEVAVIEESGEASFMTTSTTELESGAIVETTSTADSKVDSIVAIGQKLWKNVNRRVRLEQSMLYRFTSASSNLLNRIGSSPIWTASGPNMRQHRAS